MSTATSRTAQALMVRTAVHTGDWDVGEGLELARALEAAARGASRDEAGLDRALCAFLGDILARRGPDVHDYLSGLTSYGPPAYTGHRHACGCRLLALTLTITPLHGCDRQLHICERCGVSGNVPLGTALPRTAIGSDGVLSIHSGPEWRTGWYTASRQPVGGHREEPIGVRAMRGGRVSVGVPPRPADGLRRWGVAIVAAADYAIVQLPVDSAGRQRGRLG